mmetsp:Transcript_31069/g.66141  ORF Transcript_31069/g.66141 Transcript_31069/m.66141 type:complete len:273 (-) Transcript_31069:40-858(-)
MSFAIRGDVTCFPPGKTTFTGPFVRLEKVIVTSSPASMIRSVAIAWLFSVDAPLTATSSSPSCTHMLFGAFFADQLSKMSLNRAAALPSSAISPTPTPVMGPPGPSTSRMPKGFFNVTSNQIASPYISAFAGMSLTWLLPILSPQKFWARQGVHGCRRALIHAPRAKAAAAVAPAACSPSWASDGDGRPARRAATSAAFSNGASSIAEGLLRNLLPAARATWTQANSADQAAAPAAMSATAASALEPRIRKPAILQLAMATAIRSESAAPGW